jgi:hypothetical protein
MTEARGATAARTQPPLRAIGRIQAQALLTRCDLITRLLRGWAGDVEEFICPASVVAG